MLSFVIQSLEMHLPAVENVIAFIFLLKSQEDLHRKMGVRSNFFVSLSTILWRDHLQLLGQSQNSMELLLFCSKESLSSQKIADE